MMDTHYKLRKCCLVAAVTLLGSLSAFAQREVLYEQYVQNPMAINPGFTGAREDFNMTAMFRRKWFNIPNSPSSQTFAADGTVANGKFGIGFQALNDQTSYFTTTGLSASFAFHLGISDNWKLGLGAQGGINVLPVSDLSFNNTNRALGSFGLGAWLRSDQLYFGISKPEVLSQSFGNQAINNFYRRPLYIMAGGSHDLSEDVMMLPHVLVIQEKDHKLRVDFGSRFWFNKKVGIGASYRVGGGYNAVSAKVNYLQLTAEVQVGKNVRLGYFYSTRQVEQIYTTYSGPKGIHELMLKFVPNPKGFQKY
ncbi:PorP/SprF family type IX secretion system membrane protein [Dyadobacter luticola]|uniref:Type IX secretion system membrane protein PorP/SprF n=1 Tax=Dyadobacter luticola TaxID=1979387 RepID=A0A5R9L5A2_9BACT|nr:PorP/SprF family type IX secretion system membrane protein [Dyadobacter luticola]TLV03618.1 type IX secretion system membrane protein PorP/SprF [Dyadobacter luticola]